MEQNRTIQFNYKGTEYWIDSVGKDTKGIYDGPNVILEFPDEDVFTVKFDGKLLKDILNESKIRKY